MEPIPHLSISPDPFYYDFGTISTGETASWTFTISNTGGGTLTWNVIDDKTWITLYPSSGSNSGTVKVQIDTAGLSSGTHTGTIEATSNGGTKTGTINLNVLPLDDISHFQVIDVSNKEITITVDYNYNSDHGDRVYIGAGALSDGKELTFFGYGPSKVYRDGGSATIPLSFGYNNPPTSVITDQVKVKMYVGGGSVFYSETFDFTKTWSTGLATPTLIAPTDGSVFDHYPRTTTLEWSTVSGAASYIIEIEYCSPAGCDDWAVGYSPVTRTTTSYTFNFVGAQPGRWRVWGVDVNGQDGPKSDWWEFRYTR